MLLRHFPLNAVALAQSNNKNQKKKYQPLLPWWLVPMYVSMYSNGWRRQRSSIETKQTRYGLPWPQSKRCTYARMCVCTESIRYRYTHLKIERLSSRVLDGNKRVDTNMYIHMYVHMTHCCCIRNLVVIFKMILWILCQWPPSQGNVGEENSVNDCRKFRFLYLFPLAEINQWLAIANIFGKIT